MLADAFLEQTAPDAKQRSQPSAAAAAPSGGATGRAPAAAASATASAPPRAPQIQQQMQALERAGGAAMTAREREALKAHLKAALRNSAEHQRDAAERNEARRRQTELRWQRGEVNPFQPSVVSVSDFVVLPGKIAVSTSTSSGRGGKAAPASAADKRSAAARSDATPAARKPQAPAPKSVLARSQPPPNQQGPATPSVPTATAAVVRQPARHVDVVVSAAAAPPHPRPASGVAASSPSPPQDGRPAPKPVAPHSLIFVKNHKPGADVASLTAAATTAAQGGLKKAAPPPALRPAPGKRKQRQFTAQRHPTAIKRAVHRAREQLFEMYAGDVDRWYESVAAVAATSAASASAPAGAQGQPADAAAASAGDAVCGAAAVAGAAAIDAPPPPQCDSASSSSDSVAASDAEGDDSDDADDADDEPTAPRVDPDELAAIVLDVVMEMQQEDDDDDEAAAAKGAVDAAVVGEVLAVAPAPPHDPQPPLTTAATATTDAARPTVQLPAGVSAAMLRRLHRQVARTRGVVRDLQELRAAVHRAFLARDAQLVHDAVRRLRSKMRALGNLPVPRGGVLAFRDAPAVERPLAPSDARKIMDQQHQQQQQQQQRRQQQEPRAGSPPRASSPPHDQASGAAVRGGGGATGRAGGGRGRGGRGGARGNSGSAPPAPPAPGPPATPQQRTANDDGDDDDIDVNGDDAAAGCEVVDDAVTRTMVSEKLSHLFFPRLWSYEGVGLHPRALQVDRRVKAQSWPAGRLVRDYVTNVLSRGLDDAVGAFLSRLQFANTKLRTQQPLHFKARMRYVLGFREVLRGIAVGRVKFVIVAPDVEPAPGPGGLDDHLRRILAACGVAFRPAFQGIAPAAGGAGAPAAPHLSDPSGSAPQPAAAAAAAAAAQHHQQYHAGGRHPPRCIFAMGRGALGRVFHQSQRNISAVGVFSADGAYDELRVMLAAAGSAMEEYQALMAQPAPVADAAAPSPAPAMPPLG